VPFVIADEEIIYSFLPSFVLYLLSLFVSCLPVNMILESRRFVEKF